METSPELVFLLVYGFSAVLAWVSMCFLKGKVFWDCETCGGAVKSTEAMFLTSIKRLRAYHRRCMPKEVKDFKKFKTIRLYAFLLFTVLYSSLFSLWIMYTVLMEIADIFPFEILVLPLVFPVVLATIATILLVWQRKLCVI